MQARRIFAVLLLVAIACISCAAAASNVVTTTHNDVFIGEEGLNVTDAVGTTSSIAIDYYPSGSTVGVDVPQSVTIDPNSLYVSSADFGGRTGNWYRGGTTTVALVVNEPSIMVSVRDSEGNDITGKSIVRGEKINFRVESNLYKIFSRTGCTVDDFKFKIKVESPSGVTYTTLSTVSGDRPIVNVPVNAVPWMWGADADHMWNTNAKDSGHFIYESGTYVVSAECNADHIKDNYNPSTGKTVSSAINVKIASDVLSLSVNKESVVRGQQFTVSISGVPNGAYKLFVKNSGSDIAPKIISGQEGVTVATNLTFADVTLSTTGMRSVGFSTYADTKDKKWTIRVETPSGDKNDEIAITVKAGAVTVTAEGEGSYYLGEEVKLTGTNTETDTVYLFMTGPNLPSGGARMTDPRDDVHEGDAGTFASATVKDDNTWEYKWQTSALSVDSGSYTVFAVAEPHNRDNLGDVAYDTVSVNIRKPFITATVNPSIIARGSKLHITGNAGVETSQGLAIWIAGKNHFVYDTVSVEEDGTYDYEMKSGDTDNLASGQYFVVVQHPMYNDQFDVYLGKDNRGSGGNDDSDYVVGTYPTSGARIFKYKGAGALQGSEAANALVSAIDNNAIDDAASKTQFVVSEPQVNIAPIGTVQIGQKFTISGTTNLNAGEDLQIEAYSISFGPTNKNTAGEFSGFSGQAEIISGNDTSGMNTFSIVVDSSSFIKDEYLVTASSLITSASGSKTFNVVPFVPTTVPTPTPTPVPTTITTVPTPTPTVIATTVTTPLTPEPTKPSMLGAPGFGIGVCLVGLVIVGYLVIRKDKSSE